MNITKKVSAITCAVVLGFTTLTASVNAASNPYYENIKDSQYKSTDILSYQDYIPNDYTDSKSIALKASDIVDKHLDANYCKKLTDSSDRNDVLKSLLLMIDTYDECSDDEKEIIDYVIISHSRNFKENEKIKSFINENYYQNQPKSATSTTNNYSASKALNYAKKYAYNYNYDYPDMSEYNGDYAGDCANFISQCLYKGGLPMEGRWYCYKKNGMYPAPETASELNASWDLYNGISPWISADGFEFYWANRAYDYFEMDIVDFSVYDNRKNIYNEVAPGDVLMILKKNWYGGYSGYHTMMITSKNYTTKDIQYTAHTSNCYNNRSILDNIVPNYDYRDFKLEFIVIKNHNYK